MDKRRPMTEEELLELSEKLNEQCRMHDDREADLEARERLLNDRLSDLSERDQANIEKETKLRDIEAELRKLEISFGERELELKSRELVNQGEPNELKVEFERRLQELKDREAESSQLLEQAKLMQTERLNKREATLANRERELTEIQEKLNKRERDLVERENAVVTQEKEMRNDSKLLQTWASELKQMKTAAVTKTPSVIQELKEEMSQLRSNGPNELTCNANITIKDALSYVPTFDGTSAAVSDFIRSCSRACSMLAPSAEFMFLTLVRQKFKGDARIAVENMEYSNMKEFENLLRTVFDRHRSANQCKAELENIIMRPKENMVSYVNRARTIYRDILHAETTERGTLIEAEKLKIEKDAISAFLNGIPPLLQVQCLLKPHDTLEQTYASSIAAFKNQEDNAKLFQTRVTVTIAHIQSNQPDRSKPPRPERQVEKNRDLRCNYCDKRGHFERDCLQKKGSSNNSNNKFNNDNKFNNKYNNVDRRNRNDGNKNKPRGNERKPEKDQDERPCCEQVNHSLANCFKFAALMRTRYGPSGNSKLPGKNDDGSRGSPKQVQSPPKNPFEVAHQSTSRQS